MRVAIIHYWLVGMRGGEKVLEALCEMFPEADIYTHVYNKRAVSDRINRHRIRTSFIAKLPFARKFYQLYLPLMPAALEEFDLTGYDLVISSESGPAKGVITRPDTLHVCYCHTPMRYIWDQYHAYRSQVGLLRKLYMSIFLPRIRIWDAMSAGRVDFFIANSSFVAKRIRKVYRREAKVVFPPIDVKHFSISKDAPEDYYLFLGQLVSYKRPDLAIEAFNRLGYRLIIVGTGPDEAKLKKMARPNIEFRGWESTENVANLLRSCKAMIFPGEEDFGITALEAMASGRPVLAYGSGGVLDTVVDGSTGLFFEKQTADSLVDVVRKFERELLNFDPQTLRAHAMQFHRARFKDQLGALVSEYSMAAKTQ